MFTELHTGICKSTRGHSHMHTEFRLIVQNGFHYIYVHHVYTHVVFGTQYRHYSMILSIILGIKDSAH